MNDAGAKPSNADAAEASGMPPASPARVSVCALLTCFNRRESTLACLRALAASQGVERVALHAVLVDDGSTDGTGAAVRAEFPWVEVLSSDGQLFWCRGMHMAFAHALGIGHDHYLWLNDDTHLRPDALRSLLDCAAERQRQAAAPVIVIGTTVDPVSGQRTYGGERTPSRWRPLRVEPVEISSQAQRCDTFNGNVVLIPAAVAQAVGNLSSAFEHAMGDTDYGLRARRLGVEMWTAPGVQGTCARNPETGTHRDENLPFAQRWKRLVERKGLPLRSWFAFTRRHAGVMWPVYFLTPYAKLLAGAAGTGLRRWQRR